MLQRYLVTYDVRDPKRLRRTLQAMRGFGTHMQLSVFLCDLTQAGLISLRAALAEVIHVREDSVLIVDMGPTEGRGAGAIEFLGVRGENPLRGPMVF